MIRQIASLLALLLLASVLIAYACLPSHTLVGMLAVQFDQEELMHVAARGPFGALTALVARNAVDAALWIAIGAAVAMVAWVGLWKWTKPQSVPKEMQLADEAGGTVKMYASHLSHDPGIRFLSGFTKDVQLRGATEFESEVFQFIADAGPIPFDIENISSGTLLDHVRSAYSHVVNVYGPGSLAAALSISFQSGKVHCYSQKNGRWNLLSDKFAQQSMVIVRRMRTYYKLPKAFRRELMLGLGILSSNSVPEDLSDEVREIIRAVRIADMGTGVPMSAVTHTNETGIDVRAIATLVSGELVAAFSEFNVNLMRSKSDPIDAIFVKQDGVLLVPPKQMRAAMAKLLPPAVSEELKLDAPAQPRHPSDGVIKQVLDITGVLVPVYRQVTCTSGVYSVRSGHRKFPSMWALSTKKLKQEILDSWGDWSLEVEILSPGEIHVA